MLSSRISRSVPRLCWMVLQGFSGQRPLSSQRSLQLQGIHIFLHPPGVGVCTDLPVLPGDEPVRQGGVTAPEGQRDVTGQGYLPRGHLPSRLPSHKPPSIRGLQSLLKPRGQGEIKVPWENPPMLGCSWPPSVRKEPGCSAWVAGTSAASPACGMLCALGSSPPGDPTGCTGTSFPNLIPSTRMAQGDHLFLS